MMTKVMVAGNINRALFIPEGYVQVKEGNVLSGDLIWWETAEPFPAWHLSDESCHDVKMTGRPASGMYLVARRVEPVKRLRKAAQAAGFKCHSCGADHAVHNLATVILPDGNAALWCPECLAAKAKKCTSCGTRAVAASLAQVGTSGADLWCPECLSAKAEKCNTCGKWHPKDAIVVVKTGRRTSVRMCSECASTAASACNRCGALSMRGLAVSVDGSSWCPDCAESHARVCFDCGIRTRRFTLETESGEHFCHGCLPLRPAPSSSGRSNKIHGYHGFGAPRKFYGGSASSDKLFMGFELEAGGTTEGKCASAAEAVFLLSEDQERFHLERDGSIPDYGFELISAPMTLEAHKEFGPVWENVVKTMVRHGMRSHDLSCRCGLHVHVSRAALPGKDAAKIDMFIAKNRLFWEHLARRTESDYAKFLDKGASIENYGSGSNRYAALNFTNPKTVEFRLFRGTLKYSTLMGTLEIVDGVCNWIKERKATEITENKGEVKNFIDYMRGKAPRYDNALAYALKSKAVTDRDITSFEQTPPTDAVRAGDDPQIVRPAAAEPLPVVPPAPRRRAPPPMDPSLW